MHDPVRESARRFLERTAPPEPEPEHPVILCTKAAPIFRRPLRAKFFRMQRAMAAGNPREADAIVRTMPVQFRGVCSALTFAARLYEVRHG